MLTNEKLMTVDEVAALLGVPKATLYGWRHANIGPVGIRVGRHLRYHPQDVQAFIEDKRNPGRS